MTPTHLRTTTRFTELAGCRIPIQLAPIGNLGWAAALHLAVADAGGHAMFPAVGLPADRLARALDELAAGTSAFGVNFIAPLIDPAALEVALERAPMVDLFYGDPDPALVKRVRDAGALASWQVGSVEEARAAQAAGCDLIVVQGHEAGGRLRGTTGLLALLSEVLDTVDLPVLAAGGIATARGVAAAIGAGAAGARVGTRFLASHEADVHPRYQTALLAARCEDAVVARAFSAGVPDFPHRVLRCSLEGAALLEDESPGEMDLGAGRVRLPRYCPMGPSRSFRGSVEAMAFYAGQSAGLVRAVEPAAAIVADLAGGVPGECPPERDPTVPLAEPRLSG